MTKQTARKWTFKGTSASLAVVMAFGMVPASATVAMAEEGQNAAIIAEASTDGAIGTDSVVSASEASEVVDILSAAAAYSYADGYAYSASAAVLDEAGIVSFYEDDDLSSWLLSEDLTPVMHDMARYLGALHRGGGVDSIVYKGTTYEWNEKAGLTGSNWVKQGTLDSDLGSADEGSLSQYTLVGAIVNDFKAAVGGVDGSETRQLSNALSINLTLGKGSSNYEVKLGGASGGADGAMDAAASAGSTVSLNKDCALTKAVEVTKGLTVKGNGHKITGDSSDASVNFIVTGGILDVSNATFEGFGDAAPTVTGAGVFKVADTAASDAGIVANKVTVKKFNRAAFDIRQGSFDIKDCTIDCENGQESALTKGIVAGYAANSVVEGTISNVVISGAGSDFEGWSASGIEVSAGSKVDISDVDIAGCKGGISVARNYGTGKAEVTVGGDSRIVATDEENSFALRVYDGSTSTPGHKDAEASLSVTGGMYEGDVRIGVGSDYDQTGKSEISIMGGTFKALSDFESFKAFVPSGYSVDGDVESGYTVSKDEPSTGGGSGGSGGGGTGVPSEGDTVTNEDGSTTTTVTEEDGSTTATTEAADGSASTVVKKDPEGAVTSIEATVAGDAAPESTVALPMEPVSASQNAENAVSISVKAPEGTKISVPVADSEGSQGALMGCVLVMVDSEGNEIPMPKTGVSDSGLSLEIPGDCTLKVVDASADFPDMTGDEWFAEKGVSDFVSSRGIMTGVEVEPGAFEFQGDESTNRGMFVTMLHRLELEPSAEDSEGFSDVDESSWYANSSSWAVEAGVTTGYVAEDGSALFAGDGEVSREQMATFLYRYAEWLGMDTNARADISDIEGVSEWASEALSWAIAEGLIQGDDETGTVRPGDGATRAEAAVVIMRMVELFYE